MSTIAPNKPSFLLPVLYLLFFVANAACADDVQTATVGDPTKPGDLPQAVHDAHRDGAREITINPGTYEIPAMNKETFRLDRWEDTTIHAPGVTIICDELNHAALYMWQCKNVVWDGGTIEYVHPTSTQGRVTAIGTDSTGSYCDWQIDAGYPTDIDPVKSTYDIVDAATRVLKVATGDWSPASGQASGPTGLFRLHYRDRPGFAVNDWLVTRAPGGNQTSHLDDCENCTLENITFCNGGFATFFETGGKGGNHYLKCKIQPGPRPPGATEDEIVSNGADGLHSASTGVGPDIEDCVFTGVFLDDCIAIHGGFGRVTEVDGNSLILKNGAGDPVVGDPLRISDTHGFFGQANVTAIDHMNNGDVRVTLDQDLKIPIDHSQDGEEKLGTKANNPKRCGSGYKILRCRLGDTRSRGILVKADDGLIDGCTIEGCGMTGVSIGPEFWWGEANYAWNVMVSHNTFHNCSKNNGDQGTVWVHFDGSVGNRNITIQDNVMDQCYGRYIFRIEGADGVLIADNKISKAFTVRGDHKGNVVWLNDSKNITLQGNQVSQQGDFASEDLVKLDPSMNPADVKGDDSSGITVTDSSP